MANIACCLETNTGITPLTSSDKSLNQITSKCVMCVSLCMDSCMYVNVCLYIPVNLLALWATKNVSTDHDHQCSSASSHMPRNKPGTSAATVSQVDPDGAGRVLQGASFTLRSPNFTILPLGQALGSFMPGGGMAGEEWLVVT